MANFVLTITGADDSVNQGELVALSKDYPFVEWGVLFSSSQAGEKRYPSKNWRDSLYATTMSTTVPVNLSAHVCGKMTDKVLELQEVLTTEFDLFYRRIQFNRTNDGNQKELIQYIVQSMTACILPFNSNTKDILGSIRKDLAKNISLLFDSSGGSGSVVELWPEHIPEFKLCGYAGGINEDNVETHLTSLTRRYGSNPFWIDLETGARDLENNFSVPIVERILQKAAKFHDLTMSKIITPNSSIILA